MTRDIDQQVIKGHAGSAAGFLAAAIQRYVEALERDEDEIFAAADEAVADIDAWPFQLVGEPRKLL